MVEKPSPIQIVIDLSRSYEDNAKVVFEACFPGKALDQEKHLLSGAYVVFDLFNEIWLPTQRVAMRAGIDEQGLQSIKVAIALAAWNQVIRDFAGDHITIVGSGD